jgi:hypothetical protein
MRAALTGDEFRMVEAESHGRCIERCARVHVLRIVVKASMRSVLPSWASSSQMRFTTLRLRFSMTGEVVAWVASSLASARRRCRSS